MNGVTMVVSAGSKYVGTSVVCTAHVSWPSGAATAGTATPRISATRRRLRANPAALRHVHLLAVRTEVLDLVVRAGARRGRLAEVRARGLRPGAGRLELRADVVD